MVVAAQRAADLLLLDQAKKQDTWLDDVPAAQRLKNSEGFTDDLQLYTKYVWNMNLGSTMYGVWHDFLPAI